MLAKGQDVWVGLWVDDSFESVRGSPAIVPDGDFRSAQSGHAILIAGYRVQDNGTYFLLHNSWGKKWGDQGYAWIFEKTLLTNLQYAYSVDVTTPSVRDVRAEFVDIALEGDFFNGFRDGTGGYGAGRKPTGKNLVLDFKRARLAGMITATTARHAKDTIGAADYRLLGEVSNTPSAAINNGVVVSLQRSSWIVTGTCHLTALSLDAESSIGARRGAQVTMTVDGQPVPIVPGKYRGHIVLNPSTR